MVNASTEVAGEREVVECGFEALSTPRRRFSLKFYLVGVVFLIFDVEIVVVLPTMLSLDSQGGGRWLLRGLMGVLVVGLWFEWFEGCIIWG